jgi:glycosyltransferase involved in cell wall biosynthesis
MSADQGPARTDERMKICHVVPSLAEQHGGPSKSVRALAAAMADHHPETELFTTAAGIGTAPARARVGALSVASFPRDWPDRICPSGALRRGLSAARPDVIHHHSIWLRTLHYSHVCAARSRATLVVSPRGMMSHWAWHHHHWRKQLAQFLIHPGALDAVSGWHATSNEEEEELRALGFDQPICVAPNGVDAPAAAETTAAIAHWTQVCPEVAKRRVALFYSRFHPKKRLLELIDAWLEHGPADWLLLVAGIPQDYSPEMLERYVVTMSGAGRVRIFSGLGQPPPYAVASLFLLPSHTENFGLVIAEAMANGVPAIVTDTTPWQAINTDRRGWCVPWGDFPRALREATALEPNQLKPMGERAREWVLGEYSWMRSATRLLEFYRQLREEPRSPRVGAT